MQLLLLPKYEQLLSDSPMTVLDYVRCMGRKMTLRFCTHFQYKNLQEDQQNIVEFWSSYFSSDNEKFANDIINRLVELSKSIKVSIIHTQNLYMLIEAAMSISVQEEISPTPSKSELEIYFFKALLVANNDILQNQGAGLEETEKYCLSNPKINKTSLLILANQLAYCDFEFALNDEVLITQLYKCVSFFEFADKYYPKHLECYLCEKGFKGWKEYIKVLSGLAFKTVKKDKGSTFINVPRENHDKALDCCKQLSHTTIYDYKSDLDFITLRNHPLFQWNEKEFLILSNLCFT